jgi:hypothetical protein
MNVLAKTSLERIFDGIDLAGATRGPAHRTAGGGLVSRVAAAGILRLVLRWPALSVLLLSIIAARVMSRRRSTPEITRPVPRVS